MGCQTGQRDPIQKIANLGTPNIGTPVSPRTWPIKEKAFEEPTHEPAPIPTSGTGCRALEWNERECSPLDLDPVSKCATKL
jgi:hypothetical protein